MEVNKVLVELEQLIADKSETMMTPQGEVRVIRVENIWHFVSSHVIQPEDGSGGLA